MSDQINEHELYPSTYDVPRLPVIAGASQEDPVLVTIETGEARLLEGWTSGSYIEINKGEITHVCAVGAILVTDGVQSEQDVDGDVWSYIESKMTDHAKEAIKLLDESAVYLYPWSARKSDGGPYGEWGSPLEAVNQVTITYPADAVDDLTPKERVLRVYRHAAEQRRNAAVSV